MSVIVIKVLIKYIDCHFDLTILHYDYYGQVLFIDYKYTNVFFKLNTNRIQQKCEHRHFLVKCILKQYYIHMCKFQVENMML